MPFQQAAGQIDCSLGLRGFGALRWGVWWRRIVLAGLFSICRVKSGMSELICQQLVVSQTFDVCPLMNPLSSTPITAAVAVAASVNYYWISFGSSDQTFDFTHQAQIPQHSTSPTNSTTSINSPQDAILAVFNDALAAFYCASFRKKPDRSWRYLLRSSCLSCAGLFCRIRTGRCEWARWRGIAGGEGGGSSCRGRLGTPAVEAWFWSLVFLAWVPELL